MIDAPILYHKTTTGHHIAYRHDGSGHAAQRCGIIWLGGFRSDMDGTKARALSRWAHGEARSALRFDYSGHGHSGGRFEDGTISVWLEESAEILLAHGHGPRVIIGSSMGGWIALLLMKHLLEKHPNRARAIRGLVLIAPAADMTERLMTESFTLEIRREIEETGVYLRPSAYGDGPYPITRALIEDGRRHLILDQGLTVPCPTAIVHGDDDPDVPWQHGLRLFHSLSGQDVTFTLVKGGDHRLSDERGLAHIVDAVARLCAKGDRDTP